MIAQSIVDGFTRALLLGEPLKLPDRMWLGLTHKGAPVANMERVSLSPGNWKWDSESGEASNAALVQFAETMADVGPVDGAALYDAAKGGEVVATFELPLRNLERRTIVQFGMGDLRVRF